MKRYLRAAFLISVGTFTQLSALSLEESVKELIDTNPIIQERLKNFRSVQQDVHVADSGYLPSVDLVSAIGHKEVGVFNKTVARQGYDVYQNSLTLTQNLFDGFGTINQVNYEKARVIAAAYNYVETVNDVALQMTEAYINFMRSNELYETSQENVKNNTAIYAKVYDLYVSGLAKRSEVDKIQSSLALSRSNLTVKRNNLMDARFKFHKILGRNVRIQDLDKLSFKTKLPDTRLRTVQYSMMNNPSILVSKYNIKTAQELYKSSRQNYYPKLDLEVSQHYNDNFDNFTGQDDRFQAMLILSYNLYRGGADSARAQKNISKVNQEIELQRKIRREVIEGLLVSWSAKDMLKVQLDDLYKYQNFSYSTFELYKDEYSLGKRSLLDLLAAQNDFFNAQTQIINAEYDRLFAKYRILDSMGLLVLALGGADFDYYQNVGLSSKESNASDLIDALPVSLDSDNDQIPDDQDICSNSFSGSDVYPTGCVKYVEDSDGDGVTNSEDQCKNTPLGFDVEIDGCPISKVLPLIFEPWSNKVDKNSELQVEQFARFLAENPLYNIIIIGHTDNIGTDKENQLLSLQRAQSVKQMLINLGIEEVRINAVGHGESEPIANNATKEGRSKNRRTEIRLNYIPDVQGDK